MSVWACASTWDLEEEVVSYRVTGPPLLENNIGQKVIIINGNSSMVVHYQCWSFVRYFLHPMDFIAWYTDEAYIDSIKTCTS